MKKIIWLILFLGSFKIISAQCENEIKLVENEKNDTLKIRKWRKLLDCYYDKEDFEGVEKLLAKIKIVVDRVVQNEKDSTQYRNHLGDRSSLYYFREIFKNLSKFQASF